MTHCRWWECRSPLSDRFPCRSPVA
jgi:hypothetical protein